jgi:hypothetical protein
MHVAFVVGSIFGAGLIGLSSKWLKRKRRGGQDLHDLEPLPQTVSRCEAGWVLEDLQAAIRGDGHAMLRMKRMLMAGYGAKQPSQGFTDYVTSARTILSLKDVEAGTQRQAFHSIAEDDLSSEDGTVEEERHDLGSSWIASRRRSLDTVGTRNSIRRSASDPSLS